LPFVALGALAVYLAVMAVVGRAVWWIVQTSGLAGTLAIIGASLLIAIWIERRRQKKAGVKRPLFRWSND
jgi:Na+/H+ antiporter NhaA